MTSVEYVFKISARSGEHAASKTTVGVNVGGGVGVAVGVCVAVAVGVGVAGIMSLVAAWQAKVEKRIAAIQRNLMRGLPVDILGESSTRWELENLAFCLQV